MHSISPEDNVRRLKLRVAVKVMLYLAFAAVVYVIFSAIRSGTGEVPIVPTMKVDTRDIEVGEMLYVTWEGRPVMIYRRTDEDILSLRGQNSELKDADSKRSKQPEWASGPFRSADLAWFVAIGLGTDLGCTLEYLPRSETPFQGQTWQGGFIDTCRKSRYDQAGRVYKSQYATHNLVVPSYRWDSQTLILGQ